MTSKTSDGGQLPLLGVAGDWGRDEVQASLKFNELHQMIYSRGGITPSNAALEELSKLIFLRLWSLRRQGVEPLASVVNEAFSRPVARDDLLISIKQAFTYALTDPQLCGVTPSGATESIWPLDEPFKLENSSVLSAALSLIGELLPKDEPTGSDPFGTAFDALLSGRYDHSGGLGTYLTPSNVSQMMANVGLDLLGGAELESTPLIGDPYCGTGRFLVAAMEALFSRGMKLEDCAIFGADQSRSAVAKARINMLLYGLQRPEIWTVRDSVVDPDVARLHWQAALILTNPPFGDGKYDDVSGIRQTAEAVSRVQGRSRIDPALACLVKSIRLLRPGGVLGIVLPDGLVESRGFEQMNGWMNAHIASVVSLPTATFSLSGTVAKTSAVFFKNAESRPRRISLARVEHVGYVRQGGKAAPDPEGNELPALPRLIKRSLTSSETATLVVESRAPLVAAVDPQALPSLDPSRIDPVAIDARATVSAAGAMPVRSVLTACRTRRAKFDPDTPFISVLHLDELGTIAWHQVDGYAPATPGIVAPGGSLIVSLLNPSKFRASVVPVDYAEVHVSAEFGVFSPNGVDPYGVLALLYSPEVREQLRPLGKGTSSSRRRIDTEDVLDLIIPERSAADLRKSGERVKFALEGVRKARHELDTAYRSWSSGSKSS